LLAIRVVFVPFISFLFFGIAIWKLPALAIAQSAVPDDVKHDTPGQLIKPGQSVHIDVDLALVNVTVTDPYDRLVTGLEPDMSDGGDNNSRYTEKDIKRMVREAATQLYSIGIFDVFEYRSRTPEELSGPSLLSEVTELTGGRAFTVENINEPPDIAAKIGAELRNQHILGYRPSNKSHDARWRKIKVKLRAPKGLPPLSVYAKTGYYAPSL
jgi:hypothetical protein